MKFVYAIYYAIIVLNCLSCQEANQAIQPFSEPKVFPNRFLREYQPNSLLMKELWAQLIGLETPAKKCRDKYRAELPKVFSLAVEFHINNEGITQSAKVLTAFKKPVPEFTACITELLFKIRISPRKNGEGLPQDVIEQLFFI